MVSDFEKTLLVLADVNAPLTTGDLYALSDLSRNNRDLFVQRWPSIALERRRQIVRLLAEAAERNYELDYRVLLRATMQDEDAEVRALSIEGLWEDEDFTLVQPLASAMLHDPAEMVRAAAAISLARFVLMAEMGDLDERYARIAREALWQVVRSPNETLEVRRRAIESIAYLCEEGVREVIAEAYAHTSEQMRLSAVFAMGRTADPYWTEIILNELDSESPAMRYEAARAAGELQAKAAVTVLIRLIEDPDPEVREAAIWALGQIGGNRAQRALERCCQGADEALREAAEEALAELTLGSEPFDLLVYGSQEAEENESEETDEDEYWDEEW